nr:MAG TPA: hypothetical protein [Caudoviricetes sp.]
MCAIISYFFAHLPKNRHLCTRISNVLPFL